MNFPKLGGMAQAWTRRNGPEGPEDARVASLPGGRQSSVRKAKKDRFEVRTETLQGSVDRVGTPADSGRHTRR